jgi:hypothetical protein
MLSCPVSHSVSNVIDKVLLSKESMYCQMRHTVVTLKKKSVGIEEEPSGQSVPSRDLNWVFLECKTEALDNSKNYGQNTLIPLS